MIDAGKRRDKFVWSAKDIVILHRASADGVRKHEVDDSGHEGVWRTVRGRKVFIREGEDLDSALKRSGIKSTRAERAKATHKPATREKQLEAAKYEKKVAHAIGGKDLDDHEPFDVLLPRHAVEVKTILDGTHPKITMHPESLARKEKYVRKNKVRGHTVVIDARNRSKPEYYYRRGMGSFRLSGMEKVSLSELRGKF